MGWRVGVALRVSTPATRGPARLGGGWPGSSRPLPAEPPGVPSPRPDTPK